MKANKKYFVDVFQDIIDSIVEIYDPIVAGVPPTGGEKPYAMYGHLKEVLRVLSEKDESQAYKFKKYPLIVLIQDFEETHNTLANQYTISPRIIILEESKREYKADDRYINSFKTVLYPLYELLLEEIAGNPYLNTVPVASLIPHKKYDRLNWGTQQAGDALNDYLDGIDITLTDLKVFAEYQNCETVEK